MTAGFHSVHAHTYYHAKFLLVLPHRNNNPSGRIRCYLIFLKDEIYLTVMAYVKLFRKIIYTNKDESLSAHIALPPPCEDSQW